MSELSSKKVTRRQVLKAAGAAGIYAGAGNAFAQEPDKSQVTHKVKLGVVGTGGRGKSLMRTLLTINNVQVPAVCDINPQSLAAAQQIVVKSGQPQPQGYLGDAEYKKLMDRDDLDAVIIATPWDLHTPMAVYGMKAKKTVGVEVPAAYTLEECWELINVHEKTGTGCMMMENWSFRQDNLAVLNMIRQGLLGKIVHCHCAHSHDCIDHWFFDRETGKDKWPAKYLIEHNRDQYPTHQLGPVLSWMDINCGDAFDTLTSTATGSFGINDMFERRFGKDHPGAKRKYAQGDIVTTVVKTKKGKTIVINYDMQLPRPYDNRWTVQGTRGIYNEQRDAVYLTGKSPEYHKWEPFGPYQEKYDHKWTKGQVGTQAHSGTDYRLLKYFVEAIRNKAPLPIDIYDSITMCVTGPLSELSISQGSNPVEVPDFTRGKWKTKKPYFAM